MTSKVFEFIVVKPVFTKHDLTTSEAEFLTGSKNEKMRVNLLFRMKKIIKKKIFQLFDPLLENPRINTSIGLKEEELEE